MANNIMFKNIENISQDISWHGNYSRMINVAIFLYDRADCLWSWKWRWDWSSRTCMYVFTMQFSKTILCQAALTANGGLPKGHPLFLRYVALFALNFKTYGDFVLVILAWILIISEWTNVSRTALSYYGYWKCIRIKQKKFPGLP